MKKNTSALKIEITWFDDHVLELRLSAWNANFSGRANFYAALDEPARFAKHIEGFPTHRDDVREYQFGSTNVPGWGGATVTLSCKDGSGHLALRVSVHRDTDGASAVAQSATVRLHTVPAAIDEFVHGLRRLRVQVGAFAELQIASSPFTE
mgnify:FL=1